MNWRMKSGAAVVGVAMMALAGAAQATTFDFSYQFVDGSGYNPTNVPYTSNAGTVTGSFQGTENGDQVTILSPTVSLTFTNGNQKVQASDLTVYAYTAAGETNCPICFATPTAQLPAVASFDGNSSNFLFSNGSTDFYVIPWTNNGPGSTTEATQFNSPSGVVDYYNGQYLTGNWSLTAVPEPTTWAMMLVGVGLAGAGLRSARLRAAMAVKAA